MGGKPKKPAVPAAAPQPRDHVLQVRPRGVGPAWWPECSRAAYSGDADQLDLVDYQWATIDPDGGWSVGLDRSHAVARHQIDALIEAWYEDHEEPGYPWEFRLWRAGS